DYVLKADDLIHIDVSAELDGYFADTGASLWVSKRSPEVRKLIEATRATLAKALSVARAGNLLNEIGRTIQKEAARRGFHVIQELTGHGIGRGLHEEPREIWNFFNPRDQRVLKNGAVLAVEPFLTSGSGHIREERDGWSLRTADNAIAAQFEHTIIVTRNEPIVLTV